MSDEQFDFDNDDELDALMGDSHTNDDDDGDDDLPESGSSDSNDSKGNKDKKENNDTNDKPKAKDDDSKDDEAIGEKLNPKKMLGRKIAAEFGKGGSIAGGVLYGGQLLFHLAKMMLGQLITLVKTAINAIIGAVVGVATSIAAAIGVPLAVAVSMVVGGPMLAAFSVLVVAVTYISDYNQKLSGGSCVASTIKKEFYEEMDTALDGNIGAIQRDYVSKMNSVMRQYGWSMSGVAAMAGNFEIESGIDPTGVETIYSEPHQFGPKKQRAEAVGYEVSAIDSAYANRFPLIRRVGLGLGQWTDTNDGAMGNTQLREFAKGLGKKWYDFDTQMAFIAQEKGQRGRALEYMKSEEGRNMTVSEATNHFLIYWEGNPGDKFEQRYASAQKWAILLEELTVDTNYGDTILSDANVSGSIINSSIGTVNQDDGCGRKVGSEQKGVPDGTGAVPSDIGGITMWSRDELPESIKKFAHDPEKAGLGWGVTKNWTEISGQCVPFSNSYMLLLYSKQTWLLGNGHAIAENFAKVYGGSITKKPQQGAVFSLNNDYSGGAGHTGIVEHVFANGDFLIVESNITGISGDALGSSTSQRTTWSWRLIRKEVLGKTSGPGEYNWRFFKPDEEPKWNGGIE